MEETADMERMRKQKRYTKKINDIERLTPEEIVKKILSVTDPTYRAIYDIAFLTGARVTEVCTMRKEDVDFDLANKRFILTMLTEKRRSDNNKIKTVFVSAAHNQEFLALMDDFASYWLARRLGDIAPEAYIFGDPGFFEVTKTYQVTEKQPDGTVKKVNKTKTYNDNHMRFRISTFCNKQLGLNPHLLRHARAHYIAFADKEEYKKYDRMLLIQNVFNFARLESAQKYVGKMDEKQKKEVF